MSASVHHLAADVVLEKLRGTRNLYKITKNLHPAFGGTSALRLGRIVDESTARALFTTMGLAWETTDHGILGKRPTPAPQAS